MVNVFPWGLGEHVSAVPVELMGKETHRTRLSISEHRPVVAVDNIWKLPGKRTYAL
jgi:hypothetical protein